MSTIETVRDSISFLALTMSAVNLFACTFITRHPLTSVVGSPGGQWPCLSYPFLCTTFTAQCLALSRCSRNCCWIRNILNEYFSEPSPEGDWGNLGTRRRACRMVLLCIPAPLCSVFTYEMNQQWNPRHLRASLPASPVFDLKKGEEKQEKKMSSKPHASWDRTMSCFFKIPESCGHCSRLGVCFTGPQSDQVMRSQRPQPGCQLSRLFPPLSLSCCATFIRSLYLSGSLQCPHLQIDGTGIDDWSRVAIQCWFCL